MAIAKIPYEGLEEYIQSLFGPRKNYIVNPGMRISQENGTSSGTVSGYYPVDQWPHSFNHDGTTTIQQVASATPGGSTHRIRTTITAADATIATGQYYTLEQFLEGTMTADLLWGTASAKDVVLRFGFKGPAGTYAVALRNNAADRSYVREFTCAESTDEVFTLTFPGDTSGTWLTTNGIGIRIGIVLAIGDTYHTTADAWQAGNYLGTSSTTNGLANINDVFELFDVGLYADPDSTGVAPLFVLPNYGEDLAACQRYWQEFYFRYLTYTSSSSAFRSSQTVVLKRIAPTVTLSGTSYINASGGGVVSATVESVVLGATCTATGACELVTTAACDSRM